MTETSPLIRIVENPRFLRVRGGSFREYQVIGFFHDAIGSCETFDYPQLAEADCTDAGLRRFLRSAGASRFFAYRDITHAELVGRMAPDFYGNDRPGLAVELVVTIGHEAFRYQFARAEATPVESFLRPYLGDRLAKGTKWIASDRARSLRHLLPCLAIVLLGMALGIGCAFGGMLLADYVDSPYGILPLMAGMFGGMAIFLTSLWLGFRLPARLLGDNQDQIQFADSSPNPPGSRERRHGRREPFRSLTLGVIAKLCGLALMLATICAAGGLIGMWLNAKGSGSEIVNAGKFLVLGGGALSLLLLRVGQSLMTTSVGTALATDSRRPILYLRSFAVDGVSSFQPRSYLAAFLGISGPDKSAAQVSFDGSRPEVRPEAYFRYIHPIRLLRLLLGRSVDSAEQSLVRYFSGLGPVIAIGRPGEVLAESGAHREYVADEEWQSRVLERLQDSQAVVVQPGRSGGMSWELKTIFQRVPIYRILLVFPEPQRSAAAFERFCDVVQPHLPSSLPRSLPFHGTPIFLWFDACSTPRIAHLSYISPARWLLAGDAADLDHTLAPFIQGISGDAREGPRPPRPHSAASYAVAWLLAIACSLCVACCVFGGYVATRWAMSSDSPPLPSGAARPLPFPRDSPFYSE